MEWTKVPLGPGLNQGVFGALRQALNCQLEFYHISQKNWPCEFPTAVNDKLQVFKWSVYLSICESNSGDESWEDTTTCLNFCLFTFCRAMRKVKIPERSGKTFSMSVNCCSFHVPVYLRVPSFVTWFAFPYPWFVNCWNQIYRFFCRRSHLLTEPLVLAHISEVSFHDCLIPCGLP